MPSMMGLARPHGVLVPRRRSSPSSSGAGADPNAIDKSGVAPLHRAVRNRCAAAVRALIDGGADPRAPNRNGSIPLLLVTQNTGRGGSGSAEAKAQQKEIVRLLLQYGAT